MFKKRFFSYLIDVLILSFILVLIGSFIPRGSNIENLNNELISINNNFLNGEVGIRTYINQYASVFYSMDKEVFLSSLINVIVSILYFVVYPLYNNGQSIGKRINGIKIVSDDGSVSANSLIFRYLLMDGIGVSIISLCSLFIFKDFNYLVITSILGFLQFLVVIISIFMVLYRNDGKSLPDLVAGTKVIEVKE
jgi:uncharacterized RDD family membrane protein YckC